MIYELDDDTILEIEGNKVRVLPDGIWHVFDVDDNPQVEITVLDSSTVLIEYEDRQIKARIMDNEIVLE